VENKRREMALSGEEFSGVDAVLKTAPSTKATSDEPSRATIPRVAAKDKEQRIAWIQRTMEWLLGYWEALRSWKDGIREVVFPAGTWHMHRHHKANRA